MKHLLFMFFCMLLFACKPKEILMECEDRYISEKLSPDKKVLAMIKIRDCGATTETARAVQLKVLGVKDISDVYVVRGDRVISIDWVNNELLITSDVPKDDIFKQEMQQAGINISYQ